MSKVTDTKFRTGTLNVPEMIAAACAETGLNDFGEPDIREPLEAVVESINYEANITLAAERRRRAAFVGALSNRLRLNHVIAENPQIEREVISQPIMVTGLARSGTTKLQRILAVSPEVQSLPLWRLQRPFPIGMETAGERDLRIANSQEFVDQKQRESPDEYAAHPMYALQPDEDVFAMELAFLHSTNATSYETPSFGSWLAEQDFDPWYLWFKRLLQYVQYTDRSQGRRFVLKAVQHLGFLPVVFKYFPDAMIVHTHRDPATTLASFASLAHAARVSNQNSADPIATGHYIFDLVATRLTTYVADRSAIGRESQFVDVSYRDVVSRAADVVKEVCDRSGLSFSQDTSDAIKAWEIEYEQHRHGAHSYGLEKFGLAREDADAAFRSYLNQFAKYI